MNEFQPNFLYFSLHPKFMPEGISVDEDKFYKAGVLILANTLEISDARERGAYNADGEMASGLGDRGLFTYKGVRAAGFQLKEGTLFKPRVFVGDVEPASSVSLEEIRLARLGEDVVARTIEEIMSQESYPSALLQRLVESAQQAYETTPVLHLSRF